MEVYPPVNIQKTMEHHIFLIGKPSKWAMFNSYVELPEGTQGERLQFCERLKILTTIHGYRMTWIDFEQNQFFHSKKKKNTVASN